MKFFVLALLPTVALGRLFGDIRDTTVSATYEPVVFAVQAINEQFANKNRDDTDGGLLELVEIVRARTQAVAGEQLYLILHLTRNYYCDVTVWYRVWEQGRERLKITDGPVCFQRQPRALRGLVGGVGLPRRLPPTGDPENIAVLKALEFAGCASNDRSNSVFAATLGDTSGVTYTEQLTAGMTYRFYNVPLVSLTCRNKGCASLDLSTCAVNDQGGQVMTCHFQVQFQPWMNPQYILTDMTC